MNRVGQIIILSVILSAAFATRFSSGTPYQIQIGDQIIDQTTYYFSQKVDHFDPSNTAEYQQRFTVYNTQFNPVNGTVFIYIGGEGAQSGLTNGTGWFVQVAQQFSAMVICVEHRFYGVSSPFGFGDDAYSVDHLQFLTVDQSLADLAHFITFVKTYNFALASTRNPFITIGGSYPGAMSAWFRYKYPHLTVGALASSAVVNAIMDFQQYDYQIYTSTSYSGPSCPNNIQRFNYVFEQTLYAGGQGNSTLREMFGAQKLKDDEFLSFLGDFYAGLVQYGKRTVLCNLFKPDTFSEQLTNVAKYVKDNGPDINDYDNDSLKVEKYNATTAMRQWTWQVCTYFGFFQGANEVQPMRSKVVNVDFYERQCEDAFGKNYTTPHTELTNLFYGGRFLEATNIVFTNGVEDEWQWASIRQDQGDMKAIISNCTDCGHCAEFHLPVTTDSQELGNTRNQVSALFSTWTKAFFNQQTELPSFVQHMLFKSKSE